MGLSGYCRATVGLSGVGAVGTVERLSGSCRVRVSECRARAQEDEDEDEEEQIEDSDDEDDEEEQIEDSDDEVEEDEGEDANTNANPPREPKCQSDP